MLVLIKHSKRSWELRIRRDDDAVKEGESHIYLYVSILYVGLLWTISWTSCLYQISSMASFKIYDKIV